MRGSAWSRFSKNRSAMAGLVILGLELFCVLVLPMFLGVDPNVTDRAAGFWAAPSAAHWLGTDDVGRDLLARLLSGGRVSLLVGLGAAALSVGVGVPLGLTAGYFRGPWESVTMRLADVFQSFPSIILILCLVALTGPSVGNIVLVIGLLGWTSIARPIYGNTLTIRTMPYVVGARALGASHRRILVKTVLPNAIAPVWAALPLRVGRAILSESSLSFLGVGIRTPQASWGQTIGYATNLTVLTQRPWVWLPPALCIILTVVSCQLIGDGLRDCFDPKHHGKSA
ncbi:MAG: ABC transporter permease [Oscillospiraceae bacterium]